MIEIQIIDKPLSEIKSLFKQGKIEEARNKCIKTLAISEKVIESAKNNEVKAWIEIKKGILYNDLGQISTAQRSFLLALAIFTDIKNQKGEIEVYNALARIHFERSKYDDAIDYLDMCIDLSNKIKFKEAEVNAIVNRGRVYMRQGKLDLASKDLLSSIWALEEMNDEVNLSKTLRAIGYVFYLQREFNEAKKRLEESYVLIQGKGRDRDEAVYHEYSGALATAQEEFSLAHQHFYKVFELIEPKAPQSNMISQTYRLLAELQIKEKNYEEALSSCDKGLEIATNIKERIEVGAIHRALGQIYTAKGDLPKAKEHFDRSIAELKQIGASYELGLTYIESGRSSAFDYFHRITYLGNAKEIFREIGVRHYIEESLNLQDEISPEPSIHREELNGWVERIIDDMAYIVFETPKGPLERAMKLSELEAIHADRRGTLIKFVVEKRFENLEEKGIPTWRDKIKDEDLEKYDLLRKFALPPEPPKLP